MTAYFMLECYGPDDELRASIDSVDGVDHLNWLLAEPFKEPLPDPVKVTLTADGGLLMPMFSSSILLMSDELLDALEAAGVDNLDCYPAELFNPATGERVTSYKAVNIIGAVAVADLAKSECQVYGEPLFDVDFDSLTIDEARTHGLLMFRLAECVTGIVVHECVKGKVEERGISNLDWVPPEEWVG